MLLIGSPSASCLARHVHASNVFGKLSTRRCQVPSAVLQAGASEQKQKIKLVFSKQAGRLPRAPEREHLLAAPEPVPQQQDFAHVPHEDVPAPDELVRRIKSCSHWQQLAVLFSEHEAHLNAVGASAFITHLAQLVQRAVEIDPKASTSNSRRFGHHHAPQAGVSQGEGSMPGPESAGSTELDSVLRQAGTASTSRPTTTVASAGSRRKRCYLPGASQPSQFLPALVAVEGDLSNPGLLGWQAAAIQLAQSPELHLLSLRAMRVVLKHAGNFKPRQFANSLWAVSKLGIVPPPIWLQVLITEAHRHLPAFEPQHLSNTLYALAVMNHLPSEQWMQSFMAAAAEAADHMSAQELSNLVYALGKLRVEPDRSSLQKLLQATGSQMQNHGFSAQEFACVLRAFASIGVWPGQAWLHLAAQYTSFLLDLSASTPPSNHKRSLRHAPLSGQQLSMVFSCLSQYGRYTKAFPLRKLLQQVAQQCTQLSPQDFSSILVGLAHMKANPPRQWVDAVCGGMSARLPAFSSSQLALTWWALGRLCAQPPQPFVAAALYHTTRHLSDLSSGELVAMMTGVCACIKPGHEWMELVLAEVYTRLVTMSFAELSNMLAAISAASYKPSSLWMDVALSAMLRGLRNAPSSVRASTLARAISALAAMGHRPPRAWCRTFLHAVVMRMPHDLLPRSWSQDQQRHAAEQNTADLHYLRSVDCADVLWSLAVLDIQPGQAWMRRMLACVELQLEALDARDMSRVIWAVGRLRAQPRTRWMQAFVAQMHAKQASMEAEGPSASSGAADLQSPAVFSSCGDSRLATSATAPGQAGQPMAEVSLGGLNVAMGGLPAAGGVTLHTPGRGQQHGGLQSPKDAKASALSGAARAADDGTLAADRARSGVTTGVHVPYQGFRNIILQGLTAWAASRMNDVGMTSLDLQAPQAGAKMTAADSSATDSHSGMEQAGAAMRAKAAAAQVQLMTPQMV